MSEQKDLSDKVEEFELYLNSVLVYNRPMRLRYSKLYSDSDFSKDVMVFICKHTSEVIKILIDYGYLSEKTITLLCEDININSQIVNSTIYNDLIRLLSEVKLNTAQDRMADILTYGLRQ